MPAAWHIARPSSTARSARWPGASARNASSLSGSRLSGSGSGSEALRLRPQLLGVVPPGFPGMEAGRRARQPASGSSRSRRHSPPAPRPPCRTWTFFSDTRSGGSSSSGSGAGGVGLRRLAGADHRKLRGVTTPLRLFAALPLLLLLPLSVLGRRVVISSSCSGLGSGADSGSGTGSGSGSGTGGRGAVVADHPPADPQRLGGC